VLQQVTQASAAAVSQTSAAAALDARRAEATVAGSFELGSAASGRGREVLRSSAPALDRRMSRELLMPPSSPPSPVSVLPSVAASRKAECSAPMEASTLARSFCSPTMLLCPMQSSPVEPPGFSISATAVTPPFLPSSPIARTPPLGSAGSGSPIAKELEPLFAPVEAPLLPGPVDPLPLRRLKNQRKTLPIPPHRLHGEALELSHQGQAACQANCQGSRSSRL
jgi:hypothetical protein